jgi:hypothetical protein
VRELPCCDRVARVGLREPCSGGVDDLKHLMGSGAAINVVGCENSVEITLC